MRGEGDQGRRGVQGAEVLRGVGAGGCGSRAPQPRVQLLLSILAPLDEPRDSLYPHLLLPLPLLPELPPAAKLIVDRPERNLAVEGSYPRPVLVLGLRQVPRPQRRGVLLRYSLQSREPLKDETTS